MGKRGGKKFSRSDAGRSTDVRNIPDLIPAEMVQHKDIDSPLNVPAPTPENVGITSLEEFNHPSILIDDNVPLAEESLRMHVHQQHHVSFRSPLESHRSSVLDSTTEMGSAIVTEVNGSYNTNMEGVNDNLLDFLRQIENGLEVKYDGALNGSDLPFDLKVPVKSEDGYAESSNLPPLSGENITESKQSGSGEQQVNAISAPSGGDFSYNYGVTDIAEGGTSTSDESLMQDDTTINLLMDSNAVELPTLVITNVDSVPQQMERRIMNTPSNVYDLTLGDGMIDQSKKLNAHLSAEESNIENSSLNGSVAQIGDFCNSEADLIRPHTLPDKAIGLGDEDSIIIYERLKNEFINITTKKDKEVRISRCDSASDYKTAVDDYDLFSSDVEESLIIEIPNCPETPKWSLDALSESFEDTVKYMKYREANRVYRRDGKSFSCCHSICAVIMFAAAVYGIFVVDNMLWGVDTDPYFNRTMGSALYVFHELCDFTVVGAMVIAIITAINIAIAATCYYQQVALSLIWIYFFILTYALINRVTMIFFDTRVNVVHAFITHLTNVEDLTIVGDLALFYVIISSCIAFIINVCELMLNLGIMRGLYMKLASRDARRIKATFFESCTVAVPNDPVTSDRLGTIREEGHIVTLQQVGVLEPLWNLMSILTREQVIQKNPGSVIYQYVGQMNKDLKPHGYGSWQSTAPNGEVLLGYWENGLPVGTFTTREVNSSTNFSNIILGWITCTNGGALTMGVAAVEASLSVFNFGTFYRIMEYKADLFDEDNNRRCLLKYIGTPGIRKTQERQYKSHSGNVIMRLWKNTNDIGTYDFHKPDAYMTHSSGKPTMLQNLRELLCHMVPQNRGYKHLNSFVKCMFRVLECNIPSFSTNEGTESLISMDTKSQLYVDGFVPFDVTFDKSVPPISSKDDSAVTIRVNKAEDGPNPNPMLETVLCRRINETFTVNGWKKRGYYKKPEVCIFIHGCNKSTKALYIMGKLFALWKYPQYIKPLTFGLMRCSWFQKRSISRAKAVLSQNKEALMTFLRSLLTNGITDVHFLVDSTGTEMFLESFASIVGQSDTACIFRNVLGHTQIPDAKKINLMSITLLFPMYNLERFTKNIYEPLRSHCKIITIFGGSKQRFWFGSGNSIVNNIKKVYLTTGDHGMPQDKTIRHDDIDGQLTVGVVQVPSALFQTPDECGNHQINCHGSNIWLDVDCIDVTWLPKYQNCMPNLSWYLSRVISEDIRELMTSRKRAKDRVARLDRTLGNVWTYRNVAIDHGSMWRETRSLVL